MQDVQSPSKIDPSLIQRSPEWLAARRHRIGSSDIAVIMRESPYKKRRALWEEKTGRREAPDISGLWHVRRGNMAEPVAIRILERAFQTKYASPTILHSRYPFMAASVDGICDTHLVEIKTMGEKAFRECFETGIVPEHYRIQIQWQLMISGLRRGYFVPFKPETNEIFCLDVHADPAFQRKLLANALIFHRWVLRDIPPPDEAWAA